MAEGKIKLVVNIKRGVGIYNNHLLFIGWVLIYVKNPRKKIHPFSLTNKNTFGHFKELNKILIFFMNTIIRFLSDSQLLNVCELV